jgi:ComF family protein
LNRYPLGEDGRCALCRLGASRFDEAWCFGAYDGTLRELIHLFKYDRIRTLAGPLGARLAAAVPMERCFDVVVPTPLHWLRRWRRGFNQSDLLARELARRLRIPVRAALRRRRVTRAQAGLTYARRRANVSGAFTVRRPEWVAGKRVLLVDDVMTTGATANACAAALKQAGAARVTFVAVARVDRRPMAAEPSLAVQSVGASS